MEEEDLRVKVSEGMRRLYDRGLVSSLGGNLSARSMRGILITPSGSPKWKIGAEDIVEVDMEGNVISGRAKPSSELPSHLLIYRSRGDVLSVAHAHPPHAVALANAGILSGSLHATPEEVLYLKNPVVLEFAPPGAKTAEAISGSVQKSDIIIVKNHGVFSMGKSIEEAIAKIEILEEASKMFYIQLSLGKTPSRIPETLVREIIETYKKK